MEVPFKRKIGAITKQSEGKQYKCGGGGGGEKIIKIVEEGIKTLRRENNKIVEKGIKKIEERNKIEKGEG